MPAKKKNSPVKASKGSKDAYDVDSDDNSLKTGKRSRRELNYNEHYNSDEEKKKKNEKKTIAVDEEKEDGSAKKRRGRPPKNPLVEEEEEKEEPAKKKRGRPSKSQTVFESEEEEEKEEEPVKKVKSNAKVGAKEVKEVVAPKANPKSSPVKLAAAGGRSKGGVKETVREPETSDDEVELKVGGYSKEAFESLKRKYDQLVKLNSSSSKDDELKRLSDEKADKIREDLMEQNKKLKEEVKELKGKASKGKDSALQLQCDELKQSKEKLEENLKSKTQLLSFFQTFSGVSMRPSGENKYDCECRNTADAKKSLQFELTVTENEIEYAPLNASQFKGTLPPGLKQTICFTEDNLPKFLLQLLGAQYVR